MQAAPTEKGLVRLSLRAEKSWSIHCDWPTCDYQFESGDYTVFGDGWEPDEIVTECDGWVGQVDGEHYCYHHLVSWFSDHEDGEPFPTEEYLLIHDGDTVSPIDDDGKVTYVDGRKGKRPGGPDLHGPV